MSSTKPYHKVKTACILTQCIAGSQAKIVTQSFEHQGDSDNCLQNILVWTAPQCITRRICKSNNIFPSTDHPIVGGHGSYLDTTVETLSLADLLRKFTRHSINWPYLTFTVIDETKMWIIRYLPVKKFSAMKYNIFPFQSMHERFIPTIIWWLL